MSYKDVPNNQADALRAGYFHEALGIAPTVEQVAHRVKLGICDEYTANVSKVEYKPFRYRNDANVFTHIVESFDDLVGFLRGLPPDKVVVGLH